MRRAALTCFVTLALLTPAGAQTPPPAPHEVAPVTIYPLRERPKVVATFPAADQAVPPGVLILTVTFNQEMSAERFDVTAAAGGEAPKCLKTPRLLDDSKTFGLLCTTRPGTTYALAFNAGAAGGFANVGGQPAEPAALSFTTTKDSDGPRNIEDAMKQAKLTRFEVPIQETPGLAAKP